MLREMNHRVKNLFAVIAGMITVASRNHDEVRPFATDLRRRIAAKHGGTRHVTLFEPNTKAVLEVNGRK